MVKNIFRFLIAASVLVIGLLMVVSSSVEADDTMQQPTGSIATVTSTPTGPIVRVNADNDYINVRSGPGTNYIEIGVLIAGETISANGRTQDGAWIQINYPGVEDGVGWVYSPLVTLISGGELPILEPPPTATPRVTATINPTLAAQFIDEIPATRLPTFTPPAPLVIPTFQPENSGTGGGSFPVGLIIVLLGAVGIMGGLFSLIRGR